MTGWNTDLLVLQVCHTLTHLESSLVVVTIVVCLLSPPYHILSDCGPQCREPRSQSHQLVYTDCSGLLLGSLTSRDGGGSSVLRICHSSSDWCDVVEVAEALGSGYKTVC